MNSSVSFSFHKVSKEDLIYQLNCLDLMKATQKCDISTNIIKKNYDIFSEFLFANFNEIILTSLFPEHLKCSDIKLVFKKDFWNGKRNYKPVSILSIISKIYERLLYKQRETYFELCLNICVDSEKDLVYWPLSFSNLLTQVVILEHYWLICQMLSIVYRMTYFLLSLMHMD